MGMNINEEFLQLVKDIVYWGNIEEEDISVMVGRNKGYISQVKSRIKAGKEVPESFVNLLKLKFAEELKRKDVGGAYIEDAPAKTIAYIIRVLSKVNVLFSIEAERTAKLTGQKSKDVLDKMNKAALGEVDNLFEELKQRS